MDKVNFSHFELSVSLGIFLKKTNTVNQWVKILKAHEKAVHTVFDTRKNTQRLNVCQVHHQKKKKKGKPTDFLSFQLNMD